jgi:hypothetical protein
MSVGSISSEIFIPNLVKLVHESRLSPTAA